MQTQRVPFLGQQSQHVIVSWREGIYKVGVVGGDKDCQEVYNITCMTTVDWCWCGCMGVGICVWVGGCMCVIVCNCVHVHMCVQVCAHVCACVCVCVRVCAHARTTTCSHTKKTSLLLSRPHVMY